MMYELTLTVLSAVGLSDLLLNGPNADKLGAAEWSWSYARSKFPSSSVRSAVAERSAGRKSSMPPARVFERPETRLRRL